MMFTADQARHANYACAALSLLILATRLAVSRLRQRKLDLSFYLVISSICVVTARIVVVYFYLLYGTASDAIAHADYFDTHDMSTVKKGSILSIVARILIAATCWLQICLLLLFYSHIISGVRWIEHMIRITWIAIGTTFIAVVLTTFLECQPFRLYWQVEPRPGKCVKGYIQILVQCITNIVLDLLLLAISYPILFCKNRTWSQHTRVAILFILGTFCIIVTSLRLASIYANNSAQPSRSLWASVQMVVSTFVANVPTIYGDLQVTQRKKHEVDDRRASVRDRWGSADTEAMYSVLSRPSRVVTTTSHQSGTSSPKEWFDHLETVEDMTEVHFR